MEVEGIEAEITYPTEWQGGRVLKGGRMANKWRMIEPEVVEMQLTQGKTTLIDKAVLPLVQQHTWCAHYRGLWYAQSKIYVAKNKRQSISMHQLLMPGVKMVDHINGNSLDNRRCNMRDGSGLINDNNRRMNNNNTSGESGITLHEKKRWHVRWNDWRKDGTTRVRLHKYFSFTPETKDAQFQAAIQFRNAKYAETGNNNHLRC